MKHSGHGRINRILVFRAGTVGDTIVALPAFHALRKAFPQATLSLITATSGGRLWTDEVLKGSGIFEDSITYTSDELRQVSGVLRLLRKVRSRRADLLIYLPSDRNCLLRIWRDRLFFRVAGIRRFQYTASKKVRWWGAFRRKNHIYPYEVDRLVAPIWNLIERRTGLDFHLPIAHDAEQKADRVLQQFGTSGLRVVALCPGATVSAKRWPADSYAKLGEKLIREASANVALIGAQEERQISESITSGWPQGRWLNLAGQLSLLESAALLKRCTVYVGNDTGAMHLAAAVGTRCLAVFGARAHERSWHPYGPNHIVIRKQVACANCYLSECLKHKLKCLTEISVEEVWASCERMLTFD